MHVQNGRLLFALAFATGLIVKAQRLCASDNDCTHSLAAGFTGQCQLHVNGTSVCGCHPDFYYSPPKNSCLAYQRETTKSCTPGSKTCIDFSHNRTCPKSGFCTCRAGMSNWNLGSVCQLNTVFKNYTSVPCIQKSPSTNDCNGAADNVDTKSCKLISLHICECEKGYQPIKGGCEMDFVFKKTADTAPAMGLSPSWVVISTVIVLSLWVAADARL